MGGNRVKEKIGRNRTLYSGVTIYNNINHYAGIQKIRRQGALLSLLCTGMHNILCGIRDQDYNNMVLKRMKLIIVIITIKEIYSKS